MPIYKQIPQGSDKWKSQTGQIAISDDELRANVKPTKSTGTDRIGEICGFVFGLGWLRFVIFIVTVLLWLIIAGPFVILFTERESILRRVRGFLLLYTRVTLRIVAWTCGVLWVRRSGGPAAGVRCFFVNHICLLELPIFFSTVMPFQVISTVMARKWPVLGHILRALPSVFIDRSTTSGASQVVKRLAEDPNAMPLAIAAEGKTTKGLFMLEFRTGGFLANVKIQPVAIRYHVIGFGNSGPIWACGGFKEWIWRCFSTPIGWLDMTFLPAFTSGKDDPKQRALECQLLIANALGVRASNRSVRECVKERDA